MVTEKFSFPSTMSDNDGGSSARSWRRTARSASGIERGPHLGDVHTPIQRGRQDPDVHVDRLVEELAGRVDRDPVPGLADELRDRLPGQLPVQVPQRQLQTAQRLDGQAGVADPPPCPHPELAGERRRRTRARSRARAARTRGRRAAGTPPGTCSSSCRRSHPSRPPPRPPPARGRGASARRRGRATSSGTTSMVSIFVIVDGCSACQVPSRRYLARALRRDRCRCDRRCHRRPSPSARALRGARGARTPTTRRCRTSGLRLRDPDARGGPRRPGRQRSGRRRLGRGRRGAAGHEDAPDPGGPRPTGRGGAERRADPVPAERRGQRTAWRCGSSPTCTASWCCSPPCTWSRDRSS